EKSTWYLDFDVNKISDAHFYEDFFFNDFRETPEPDNQVSLVHVDPAYTATLMTRFQLNDFYNVGAKLPELAIDFTRRPLWGTGIFHQGSFMAGWYEDQISDFQENALEAAIAASLAAPVPGSPVFPPAGFPSMDAPAFAGFRGFPAGATVLQSMLDEPSFARLHTYHEFLYPKTLFGWLNVTPRIGGGVTHYASIDGSPTGLESETKPIFHAGLDVSFKLSKTWSDLRMPSLGLDGLRHIFQPYVNYSYLDADQPLGLPLIDRLSPTSRPRSIDVPLFTAIDDLKSWNITRVGMRNYLQTRRDYTSYAGGNFLSATLDETQTYTWAGLNTYVDVFVNDPEFNRNVSNLYNELFFRPVPWINFWMDWQLPIDSGPGSFSELNQGITFMPVQNLHLTLGHQYVDGSPYFRDSNLIFSRVYARLNDNWGFAMNHIFEMDDGTMEFQSYSVTRDLTSWIASLGLMFRDNRGGPDDNGIIFSLTLKDFPQVNIPLDIDPNPSGRGGDQ
ncbi:MAG TPA: LPS assembly protein LptD, partial [Prosthecobacter sp.]|nr:LPS assembly protein LptD [Prosthecobacter sp.]